MEPLPEGAQEAVAGQAARQEAKQDARQEGREGGEHEPLLAEGADREQQTRQSDSPPAQEELQERFAERRQLPPVRLGIMVLFTIIKFFCPVGDLQLPRLIVKYYCRTSFKSNSTATVTICR